MSTPIISIYSVVRGGRGEREACGGEAKCQLEDSGVGGAYTGGGGRSCRSDSSSKATEDPSYVVYRETLELMTTLNKNDYLETD
jgi:hypothetical protein